MIIFDYILKRKRIILPFLAFLFSLCLVIAGFFYQIFYVGIPFQDPAAELANDYQNKMNFSEILINLGSIGTLLSLVTLVILIILTNHTAK